MVMVVVVLCGITSVPGMDVDGVPSSVENKANVKGKGKGKGKVKAAKNKSAARRANVVSQSKVSSPSVVAMGFPQRSVG